MEHVQQDVILMIHLSQFVLCLIFVANFYGLYLNVFVYKLNFTLRHAEIPLSNLIFN